MSPGCSVVSVVQTLLTHTVLMPRPKQKPSPQAEAAFRQLVAHQKRLAEIDRRRDAEIAARAETVARALAEGLTLREIAGRLGMSPERIRQMGLVKATGSGG